MQEMQETQTWSLGGKNPLEEEVESCSSILARRIPWTQEPGRLHTVHMVAESDTTEATEHAPN